MMATLSIVVCALLLPGPQDTRIEEWVGKLSSDSIVERDEAERNLIELGEKARPALEASQGSSDEEAKARIAYLLLRLDLDRAKFIAPRGKIERDSLFLHLLEQQIETTAEIPNQRDIGRAVLADQRRVHLELNDLRVGWNRLSKAHNLVIFHIYKKVFYFLSMQYTSNYLFFYCTRRGSKSIYYF